MIAEPPARHARILIAEDDPDDLFLMQRALQQLRPDLRLAAARDGIELFDYLCRCSADTLPQLIVVDLNMPLMDGREVLCKLHGDARYAALPVVVMSTSVEPEDFRYAQAHGARDMLSKPETFTEMVLRLGRLLETHLGPQPPGGAPCPSR